jgi:hypothetical protein
MASITMHAEERTRELSLEQQERNLCCQERGGDESMICALIIPSHVKQFFEMLVT